MVRLEALESAADWPVRLEVPLIVTAVPVKLFAKLIVALLLFRLNVLPEVVS